MEDEDGGPCLYLLQDMRQRLIPKFQVHGFVYKCKINLQDCNRTYTRMLPMLHRVVQGKSCIVS